MDEKEHSIRFINSSYDTLFRIPDGGTVEVQFPDRKFSAKCEYIDDYHTLVGDTVFHICEFAEMVEHQHGSVRPEPETELIRQPAARPENTPTADYDRHDYMIYSQQFNDGCS